MSLSVIHVYHESAAYLVEQIQRIAPQRTVIAVTTPDALAQALPEIEVLFAPAPPREGWARADRLRLIQLLGVGADTLLPSPDLPAHVEIAGVRGVFAADVAEHALALMLAHARGLAQLADQQRAHRWAQQPRRTLAGERITIVGHGAVGRHLARVARALAMQVRVVSRSGAASDDGAGIDRPDGAGGLRADDNIEVVPVTALADAVADAAYIVIAIPLTPATRGLIDRAVIARLRPDAFVVNVARGGIVDEAALAAALAAGHLGGAALDVFDTEPLPADSALWATPRLTITPHVAGLGEHYVERCIEALLANVAALEGQSPRQGLVNRDVGY